ncbi:helix-turn-helix domain-containing protein [Pseudonocardia xinjiangensis]|uniref:Helix-turn-helix domain-containing protein n=1 Tax=Pseudonocardia xinjiangensis TaxID=75289 RepID=A0ABX1RHG2_9PSEU|nr:XRE family transcriptional regulator [Pseudonocardia xinjiangensis]NMH79833.1 helix-turn-helix domain-containing protein [Pseudonocardia xinjiangensis]
MTTVRSSAKRPSDVQRDADARLGRAIRGVRHDRRMTLVQVAEASGLSQPFLSQLERGRTRPSMRSLFRIAAALGTTQQALLGMAAGDPSDEPVRGTAAALVDVVETGGARLLLHDPAGADITEFVCVPTEFGEYFSHERRELLYVARGRIEVELREAGSSRTATLEARDTISYAGLVEHRFRQVGPDPCVVLVVHSGGSGA